MPIGDYDPFWEGYRHSSGPSLIDEAKAHYNGYGPGPNWRLQIGTREMTDRIVEAEVTYSAEGESAMHFIVSSQIQKREYERAPIFLWIGYGTKLVPYFFGRVDMPSDSRSSLFSEVSAFGISTEMGRRYFGGRVSYADWDLEAAWWDLISRFGGEQNSYAFDAGSTTLVEGDLETFGLEHTIREAEEAILEPLGLVGVDQPGGTHVVKRPFRMDTLTRANLAGIFDQGDYPKDGFTQADRMKNYYAKVVVLRRNEEWAGGGSAGEGAPGMVIANDGSWVPQAYFGSTAEMIESQLENPGRVEYAVYAEREVASSSRYDVPKGDVYMVPDFSGTQMKALDEAEQLASGYSAGVGTYEFTCPVVDFAPYDHFGVTRTFEDREFGLGSLDYTSVGSLWGALYGCRVENTTLNIAKNTMHMTVSGSQAERERWLIRASDPAVTINLGVSPNLATPQERVSNGIVADTDNVLAGADRVIM